MPENTVAHTPGPWVVESADWWKKDNGVVRYYVRHVPAEIGTPNARLIAAAPDLLAALKKLTEQVAEVDDPTAARGVSIAVMARACAAIAKAEGRA